MSYYVEIKRLDHYGCIYRPTGKSDGEHFEAMAIYCPHSERILQLRREDIQQN